MSLSSKFFCYTLLALNLVVLGCGGDNSEHPHKLLAMSKGGLTREAAGMGTVTVQIRWADWLRGYGGQGSAGVLGRDQDHLYLVTNLHVLGIEELSKRWIQREIANPQGFVVFHNEKRSRILAFAFVNPGLDLAILIVDGKGLVKGRDYEILTTDFKIHHSPGDRVIAIGSPMGLGQTYTSGSISQYRYREFGQGNRINLIQTDASINPGNSGGPLFLVKGDRLHWIGVNTFGISGTQGLGFALNTDNLYHKGWIWHHFSPQGANEAIRRFWN